MKLNHILPLLGFLSCSPSHEVVHWLKDSETAMPLAIYTISDGFALILDTGTQQSQFSPDFASRRRWQVESKPLSGYDLGGERGFQQEVHRPSWTTGSGLWELEKAVLLPQDQSPILLNLQGHLPLPLGGVVGMDALKECRLEFDQTVVTLIRERGTPKGGQAPQGSENAFQWTLDGTPALGVIDTGYNGGVVEVRSCRNSPSSIRFAKEGGAGKA